MSFFSLRFILNCSEAHLAWRVRKQRMFNRLVQARVQVYGNVSDHSKSMLLRSKRSHQCSLLLLVDYENKFPKTRNRIFYK